MITAADFLKGNTASVPTNSHFTSAADFLKSQPAPSSDKPQTLGQKVLSTVGNIAKGIVSPVATMVARPFQAAAELAGASEEDVNKASAKIPFGLVAPVPHNFSDVKKDIGRGIETAALGLGGEAAAGKATLGALAKEGAIGGGAFGVGGSLEQGNDFFSKETLKQGVIGAATGAVLVPAVSKVGETLGKAFGKGATKVAETAAPEESKLITAADFAKLTPEEAHAKYAASQGYEPIKSDSQLPTIEVGKKTPSTLPTIEAGTKVKENPFPGKIPGYKYEPIVPEKPVNTPGIFDTQSETKIPETPRSTSRLPSTRGGVVTKAASDINKKIISQGLDSIPKEDLAKYNPVIVEENKKIISNAYTENPEATLDAAITGRNLPKGVNGELLVRAMSEIADKDGNIETQMALAHSPLYSKESVAAQTLRLSQEYRNGGGTDLIRQANKIKENNFLKSTGKTPDIAIAEEVKNLPKEVREKLTSLDVEKTNTIRQNFKEFLKANIQCK